MSGMGDKQSKSDAVPGVLRLFGRQLKLLRERAGLGRPEFAQMMGYAPTTIAAYEQGRRVASPEFVSKADEALGAGGMLNAAVDELARQRFPAFFRDFAELERDAVSVYSYESQLIPGLLQTEEYARALISAHCPPLDDETVDQRVAARMHRQEVLSSKPALVLGFVIGEAALRCGVGGPTVMKQQLEHMRHEADRRNVTIQIMPLNSGAHVGLDGPMLLLETSERHTLAYIESQQVSVLTANREEVSVFGQRYGIIRTQALGARESALLVEQVAGEL